LAFSFVPVIYFFYPETSNISLEDIDRIFLKDGETDDGPDYGPYMSERSSTITNDNESPRNEQTETDNKVVGEKHVEDV